MDNTDKKFKKTTRFCILLRNDCIRKDVNDYLKEYEIVNIEKTKDFYDCELEKDNETIALHIGLDFLRITKISKHYIDKIVIKNDGKWYQRRLEKRNQGFVVTDITKEYGISKRFNNAPVLTDLTEERYVLTNENMKKMLGIQNLDNQTLVHICLIMFNKNIKTFSDLTTKFSTHMNYYYSTIDDVREFRDNIYPTRTYLNDNEISHIYDLVDGADKLYRIHDIYNGIINKRNEEDIHSIHLGLLTNKGFDLKIVKGITEQENALIGESLIPVSEEYKNYLKQFFNDFNHYKGEIKFDRESLLNAIYYITPPSERAKMEIEKIVGMPYDKYEKLDIDEQHKLIKKGTRQKFKYDKRVYVDGFLVDKELNSRLKKLTNPLNILKYESKNIIKKILRNKYTK